MTFPSGEWSAILIGDQWPSDQDMMTLEQNKTNRQIIKTGFSQYSDMLNSIRMGPLSTQLGHTADDLRRAFQQGEEVARLVSGKNGIKQQAYDATYDSMVGLRQDLTSLAAEGNKRINDIQKSDMAIEAKVMQVFSIIQQYRTLSNLAAAKYSGNVLDATQSVLDTDGIGQSARQFAQKHGLDVGQMFRQPDDEAELVSRVRGLLDKAASPLNLAATHGANPTLDGPRRLAAGPLTAANDAGYIPAPERTSPEVPPTQVPHSFVTVAQAGLSPKLPVEAASAGTASPLISSLATTAAPPLVPNSPGSPAPEPSLPSPLQMPASAPAIAPTPAQGLTPGDLIHSFDTGVQTGAPLSGAASAVPPQAVMAPTEPQTPSAAVPAGASAPVHAPAFDSPPPVTHTPVPDAPVPQVVAGPPAAAGPVAATPSLPGSLPAYASDLRPAITTATTPAPPPSPPQSATPASAPLHPSAGQGSPGQPAVVRRETPPTPQPPASNLGTEAAAATATGAVAGTASASATARARLQRLVAAVARQQPRLAWAAGDRPDQTTILATDLASGWIPPGIEIPAAVTLLLPERRRGDLETLLGEVTVASVYTPTHHVPDEDEPLPTSPRPRQVPDIDELGWELGQATQWRDGLPRLAHTLAKAASASTGVLDSEVELLHEHLTVIGGRILDSYPDQVDAHGVGNWQLLAAIDALVAGDKRAATYHLAWFQACGSTHATTEHRPTT